MSTIKGAYHPFSLHQTWPVFFTAGHITYTREKFAQFVKRMGRA